MDSLNLGINKKDKFKEKISFEGHLGMEIYWTDHIKIKMRQYGLSENRIKRVLRFPQRIETGIAPNTIAAMQKAGSKKHPYEIWVMWQEYKTGSHKFKSNRIIMISAWRYPGISPINAPPPIPEDIWESVVKELKLKKKNL